MSPRPPHLYRADAPEWSNPVFLVNSRVACDCSGNGACDNVTGSCVCSDGWTGLSDFVNADGAQCQIFEWGVRGLWIACVLAAAIVLALETPMTVDELRRHLDLRSRSIAQRKRVPSLWSNKPLVVRLMLYGFLYIGTLWLGLLRLVAGARVGVAWASTIAWFFARVGIYGSSTQHQPYMTKFILKAQNQTRSLVDRAGAVSTFIFLLMLAAGALPFPVNASFSTDIVTARACFAVYCAMIASLQFALVLQAIYLRRTLTLILTRSYDQSRNAKVLEVRRRMQKQQDEVIRLCSMQSILYCVLLCAPPLWILFDYFLPFTLFLAVVSSRRIISTFHEASRNQSNSNTPASHRTQLSENAPLAERRAQLESKRVSVKKTEADTIGVVGSVMVVDVDLDDGGLLAIGEEFDSRHNNNSRAEGTVASEAPASAAS